MCVLGLGALGVLLPKKCRRTRHAFRLLLRSRVSGVDLDPLDLVGSSRTEPEKVLTSIPRDDAGDSGAGIWITAVIRWVQPSEPLDWRRELCCRSNTNNRCPLACEARPLEDFGG